MEVPMREVLGWRTLAKMAITGAVLMGGTNTAKAGDEAPVSCENPVVMQCSPAEENGQKYTVCRADVIFAQQGPNTHLYGCELRIRPRIRDKVSVDVQILEAGSFALRSVGFNTELQPGESQIAVVAQRPTDETTPVEVRALVQVNGPAESVK
jgi:hypothetical protein